jgi:hypothetical protein
MQTILFGGCHWVPQKAPTKNNGSSLISNLYMNGHINGNGTKLGCYFLLLFKQRNLEGCFEVVIGCKSNGCRRNQLQRKKRLLSKENTSERRVEGVRHYF